MYIPLRVANTQHREPVSSSSSSDYYYRFKCLCVTYSRSTQLRELFAYLLFFFLFFPSLFGKTVEKGLRKYTSKEGSWWVAERERKRKTIRNRKILCIIRWDKIVKRNVKLKTERKSPWNENHYKDFGNIFSNTYAHKRTTKKKKKKIGRKEKKKESEMEHISYNPYTCIVLYHSVLMINKQNEISFSEIATTYWRYTRW